MTTEPVNPDTLDANGNRIKRGVKASAIITFTRFRPTVKPNMPASAESDRTKSSVEVVSRHRKLFYQLARLALPGKTVRVVTAEEESKGHVLGAWTNLLVAPKPTNVNFGGPADGGVWALEKDVNAEDPPNSGSRRAEDVVPAYDPDPSRITKYQPFANFVHRPARAYTPILPTGGFVDGISFCDYHEKPKAPFPKYYRDDDFAEDHSCKWYCNWYYNDGNSIAQYNAGCATVTAFPSPPPSPLGVEFIVNAQQEFFLFSQGADRWKVQVKKFNSTVERALKGNTATQVRTGDSDGSN